MEQTEINTSEGTVRQYFLALSTVHIALLSGQFLFGIVAWFVAADFASAETAELSDTFILIAPVLIAGGLIGGNMLFQKQLKEIFQLRTLKEKLGSYRSALIVRYALNEMPAFFCLVAFMLTANELFFALSAVPVLFFILIRPSRSAAIKDLQLSASEAATIEDDNAVI
jgi:hypothetical protein